MSRHPGVNVQMKVNIKTDGPGEVLFTTGYNTAGIPPYLHMGDVQPAIVDRVESRQDTPTTDITEPPGPQIQLLEASADDLKPHVNTDKENSVAGEPTPSLKESKRHKSGEKSDRHKKHSSRSGDKEKRHHHHHHTKVKTVGGETETSTSASTVSTEVRSRRSRTKYQSNPSGEESSTTPIPPALDIPTGPYRLPFLTDTRNLPTVHTITTDEDEIVFNRELTKPPIDHDAIMMPSGPFTIPFPTANGYNNENNRNYSNLRYPVSQVRQQPVVKPKLVDVSMETVSIPKPPPRDISLQTDKVIKTVREQKIQTDEIVEPTPEPAEVEEVPEDLPRSLNAFAGAFQALLTGIAQDVSQALSAHRNSSVPDLNASLQERPVSSLSGSKSNDFKIEKITTFSAEPDDFEESLPLPAVNPRKQHSRESLISSRSSAGDSFVPSESKVIPVETEERGTSPLPEFEEVPIHEMQLLMEETREIQCQTESFPEPPAEVLLADHYKIPQLPPRPTNWQPQLRYEGENEYEVPRPTFGPGSPGFPSHYENLQPVISSPTKSNSTDSSSKRPIKGILKSPMRETTFPAVSREFYENPFASVTTELIDPIVHLTGSPRSSTVGIPQPQRPAVLPPVPPPPVSIVTTVIPQPPPTVTNKQRRDEFFGTADPNLSVSFEAPKPASLSSYQHLPVSTNYRVSEPESDNRSTDDSDTETSESTPKEDFQQDFPPPSSLENSQESIPLPESLQTATSPMVETTRSSITPVLIIPPPPSQVQMVSQRPLDLQDRLSPARSVTPLSDKIGMSSAKIYEIYTKPSMFKPQTITPQFPVSTRISSPSIDSERSSISNRALKQQGGVISANHSLLDDNSSIYNELKSNSTSGTIGGGGSRSSTVDSVISDVSMRKDMSNPYATMTVGQIDPILKTSTTSTTSTTSKTVKFNNLNYDSRRVMVVEETIEETIESFRRPNPNPLEKYFSDRGDPLEFMSESGNSINDVGSDIHPVTPNRQAMNSWLNGSLENESVMEENFNDYDQGELSPLEKIDDLESLRDAADDATISRNASAMRTNSMSRYAQVIRKPISNGQSLPTIAQASTVRVEDNKKATKKPPVTQTDL